MAEVAARAAPPPNSPTTSLVIDVSEQLVITDCFIAGLG